MPTFGCGLTALRRKIGSTLGAPLWKVYICHKCGDGSE